MSASKTRTGLECLINNVFLPPKLPGEEDTDEWEKELADLIVLSLTEFRAFLDRDAPALALVDLALAAVADFGVFTTSPTLSEKHLLDAFNRIKSKDAVTPIHVKAQNAGFIIRKEEDEVIFEAFELSPTDSSVISTIGRLRRYFPAAAVSVPPSTFTQHGFDTALASTLVKMAQQSVPEMQPRAKKAGQSHLEERDTVDPKIVTQLLMAYLRGNGAAIQVPALSRQPDGTLDSSLYKHVMIFFMSRVLRKALLATPSRESLYIMNAKLARRLRKLDIKTPEPWMPSVHQIMSLTAKRLDEVWGAQVRLDNRGLDLSKISSSETKEDLKMSFPALDVFIDELSSRKALPSADLFRPTSDVVEFAAAELPELALRRGPYVSFNLKSFEDWVANHLDTWLQPALTSEDTCTSLLLTFRSYLGETKLSPATSPEAHSLRLLTFLELVIACDKSAVAIHPLLADYSPEIPLHIWGSLMLSLPCDMNRLHVAEEYIRLRRGRSKHANIFRAFGNSSAFSVQYFASSDRHQTLKDDIEATARDEREKKRQGQELQGLKVHYESLEKDAAARTCDEYEYTDEWEDIHMRHSSSCVKCRLQKEAQRLSIRVHEWPLPKEELQARSTIFELDVPKSFGAWRDCTHLFLTDGLAYVKEGGSKPPNVYHLHEYAGLANSFRGPRLSVRLFSETKSHLVTHRREKPIASITSDEDVCLNNGMQWQYYDHHDSSPIGNLKLTKHVSKVCTFIAPETLQEFLQRPWGQPDGATPNTALARQSSRPDNLSTDEFRRLCELPLGHKIQWLNILRQLAIPSVDWKKPETAIFAWQTAVQAGPVSGTWRRASHQRLADPAFIKALLSDLHHSLSRLKENWGSCRAVGTFTMLAARMVSLGPNETLVPCLQFLQACRRVSWGWSKNLRSKLSSAVDDDQRREFSERALEASLVCINSFDLEENHLRELFHEDPTSEDDNAATFLDASIAVQELHLVGKSQGTACDCSLNEALLETCSRITHRAKCHLQSEIVNKRNSALDKAIRLSWQSYHPVDGEPWTAEADCWLRTKSASDEGDSQLVIHYNLITAELLVNGLPLSHLPSGYERHPMYRVFFGLSHVNVMPSAEPGMSFSTREAFKGHRVHINLHDSTNASPKHLHMRTWKDGCAWDLVPQQLFKTLPRHFRDDYVHWLDFNNHVVEFRPVAEPWTSTDSLWKLRNDGDSWHLQRGDRISLFNPQSSTAQCLSKIFSVLEDCDRIHHFHDNISDSIEIDIPRSQLRFHLDSPSAPIRSHQYRGMCVDSIQSIETLIGLRNKLVLCEIGNPHMRMILIPESAPTWSAVAGAGHISVRLLPSSDVQAYRLDNHLRRLNGNGSLQSKLFLAELHALTSSCVPDPFTMQTGTEEALTILRSEGLRSFECLALEDLEILQRLANLTPGRVCYPEHMRVMQVVSWDGTLSYLSQHCGLHDAAESIIEQATTAAFVFGERTAFPKLKRIDGLLTEREAMRSSTFHGAGFGAEAHSTDKDEIYVPRDGHQHSTRAERAWKIAATFSTSVDELPYPISRDDTTTLYNLLEKAASYGTRSICGASDPVELSKLQYDSEWLKDPLPTIQKFWCRIHQTFSLNPVEVNKYHLSLWLSTMGFAADSRELILSVLVGFASVSSLREMTIPPAKDFQLHEGTVAKEPVILQAMNKAEKSLSTEHVPEVVRQSGESNRSLHQRRLTAFKNQRKIHVSQAVSQVAAQWPTRDPILSGLKESPLQDFLHPNAAIGAIQRSFGVWSDNAAFRTYLENVLGVLSATPVNKTTNDPGLLVPHVYQASCAAGFVTRQDIVAVTGAPTLITETAFDELSSLTLPKTSAADSQLEHLLDTLGSTHVNLREKLYLEQLRKSMACLGDQTQQFRLVTSNQKLHMTLEQFHSRSKRAFERHLAALLRTLGRIKEDPNTVESTSWQMAAATHQWPRMSSRHLLMYLHRDQWQKLSAGWKTAVITFACSLTQLQASQRLLRIRNQEVDLIKELRNLGTRSWNPLDHPEAILLEVEGNLRIREVQAAIADTMRDPPDGENAIMQLNMGEGKSSVIVPIVASSLANGSQLVRVVVAKPQARQMLEMLISQLGGLIGRRVYLMPFSRQLKMNQSMAAEMLKYLTDCKTRGGVLLLRPENILSFQLMAIESSIKGEKVLATALLKIQHFFEQSARDIVDESDENFSTKFELIYTMGDQRSIDHAPIRWFIIQQVLELLARYTPEVQRRFPKAVLMDDTDSGRFPRIRFLTDEATDAMTNLVASHICKVGFDGFCISWETKDMKAALFSYMSYSCPDSSVVDFVENSGFWATSSKNLLLLRGLFGKGLLAFVFGRKRYRVNYGPDKSRHPSTRLAVPYRAKDNPSPRSEFSHPDVVICLTSLSYYYGGLSDDDLFLSFERLAKSDQADEKYQDWVRSAPSLAKSFQHIEGVNIRDKDKCLRAVFPALRFSKGAIDYFLSQIVFVHEMKEFPHKLSASGWDIGRVKEHATTGFSGTKDSQYVLPLNVKQLDLDSQKHTNAMQLEDILRPENSLTLLSSHKDQGEAFGAQQLLKLVSKMSPETRVILDVGAQIIELTNEEVARAWLDLAPHETIQAAIFCNDLDDLSVLDRRGHVERLQTSPFATQLDVCLVFLDEAHTRGIDLRLPPKYRAAVTLGANLTKDRLVQACMRMRKLGRGQSVIFCVPEEIETKIRTMKQYSPVDNITVSDILAWAISETLADIRNAMPLWATQGRSFFRQQTIWSQAETSHGGYHMEQGLAEKFLEDEAESLETRYRPGSRSAASQQDLPTDNAFLDQISQRYAGFQNLDFTASNLQEEQERELAPEIEQERQPERAAAATPLEHSLDPAVRSLVKTGTVDMGTRVFLWAFEALGSTSAAAEMDVSKFPQGLLVTRDYALTVKGSELKTKCMDDFQRDVQWVLTTSRRANMIVLSPFEANELMDEIQNSNAVVLHLYSPRQNKGYAPIDHLQLYTVSSVPSPQQIPRRLLIELNIFAGQLYFQSFAEYQEVCNYLRLASSEPEDGMVVGADGFMKSPDEAVQGIFTDSPVMFLKMLMNRVRRNCEGIESTHVGKVLDGVLLTEDDFEEVGSASRGDVELPIRQRGEEGGN